VNIAEAARRLNVAESHIRTVEEHSAGHVVTLRSGVRMLVSETTARVFVPEVDDVRVEIDGENVAEYVKEPVAPVAAEEKPKPVKKAAAKGKQS
jgi:hypothetical protein